MCVCAYAYDMSLFDYKKSSSPAQAVPKCVTRNQVETFKVEGSCCAQNGVWFKTTLPKLRLTEASICFHGNPELEAHGFVSQPNHEPPTQLPALKRFRGLVFFVDFSLVHVLLRKSTPFSTNIFSAISLRPKKLSVVGGKWLVFSYRWNSKDWNQKPEKKRYPSATLCGSFFGRQGVKNTRLMARYQSSGLRSHRKVDEANGYGSSGFGFM